MVRTVTLWSEKYYGVNAPIITGAGNIFFIENDWRDYLEALQDVVLLDANGDVEDSMQVVSFGYSAGQNRTSIELDGAYTTDHKFIRGAETNGFHPIFEPTILDIKTEWDRQGDEILAPIKSSYTSVSYANNDVWFDRFIDQYFQADDETLYLEVRFGSSSPTALEWVGNIVVDLIQWENMSKPRAYTFKATDGIDRLKGITYDRAAGTLPGFDLASSLYTIKEHVFAALSANKLDQFWGTDDPYIRESCEYYSDLVASWTDSISLFDYSLLANSLFYDKKSDSGNPQFLTCYEVLEGICEMFSLRLVFSLGVYYFQQVRNFSTVDEIVAREYKKNGATASNRITYPHHFIAGSGSDPILPMAGGMYGYFSGLAESRIDFEKYAILSNEFKRAIVSISSLADRTFNAGQFMGGVSSGKTVAIDLEFKGTLSNLGNITIIGIKMFLKNETGDITHNVVNNTNGVMIWRTALSASDQGLARFEFDVFGGKSQRLVLETAEVPSSGELFIIIEFLNASAAVIIVNAIKIASDSAGSTRRAKVINESSKPFSKILEIKPLLITEENIPTSSNTVTIWKNYPTAAKELQEGAGEWFFPISKIFPIGMTAEIGTLSVNKVREAMRLQFRPVEKYMGNWDSFYWPHQTIGYDGKIWVMNGMSRDYQMEEFNGEWFEMISLTDGAKGIIEDPKDIPIDPRERETERGFVLPYDKNRNLIEGEGKLIEVLPNEIGTLDLVTSGKYGVVEIPTTTDIFKVKRGDFIALIDPTTNARIGESFEVTKDVEEGDGKIEVDLQEFDAPIFQGAYLVFAEEQTQVATKTIRGGVLMTDANSIGNTMSNLIDNQLVLYEDKIYFKTEGNLYSIGGTLVV